MNKNLRLKIDFLYLNSNETYLVKKILLFLKTLFMNLHFSIEKCKENKESIIAFIKSKLIFKS